MMQSATFSHEHPPPLDFEAWAALSAELLERSESEQEDILDEREIDIELWEACNLFWLDELANQLRRGNAKLATRYGRRCALALQQREATRSDASDPASNPDETAFMTALNDDTAIPFPSPLAGARDGEREPPLMDDTHPAVGDTQEVSAVAGSDLPFD